MEGRTLLTVRVVRNDDRVRRTHVRSRPTSTPQIIRLQCEIVTLLRSRAQVLRARRNTATRPSRKSTRLPARTRHRRTTGIDPTTPNRHCGRSVGRYEYLIDTGICDE